MESLKHERDRFVAFAFASADILLELDENGDILYADGATKGLLGRDTTELAGSNFFDLVNDEFKDDTREAFKELATKQRIEDFELQLHSRHNNAMPFELSAFRLSNLRGNIYLSLSIAKGGVSADELFTRDFDSGLLKKNTYVQAANKQILEAKEKGEELNITLLDFPELKGFLDSLPTEQAEDLLHEISEYLKSKSVGGDTAGMIDGEAYSFVHDASVSTNDVIQDIVNLTKKRDPKGEGIRLKAETIQADPGRLNEQDSANALLYTLNKYANSHGENFSIQSLSEGYETMLDETVERIANFKEVVDDERFELAFQPIVDLKNGLIHHFEALVRIHENPKFSNPFEFITFGEEAGIINEFDLLMCERVFLTLEKASKQGNRPLVSVNLSGKSLSSTLFRDAIKDMLERHKRFRKQVIFEITESAKIDDLADTNIFIQELREAGNLCCLDDFGTGESSFEYLRNLQVDFIKIDGSYVRESLSTPLGRRMLKAMSGLCRDLNVTTIGEMVEDEKAAKLLWEAGVKFGQGYLFGKPTVDAEELENCNKPTPFYGGMMRARRVQDPNRKWWKKVD